MKVQNSSNTLSFGSEQYENYTPLQDTGGQQVVLHEWNETGELIGIQIGDKKFGDTTRPSTANFTLPQDGTFTLLELMARDYVRVGYIRVNCDDSEYTCGSNNYNDTRLNVKLKVKFAGIGSDGAPGNGCIRLINFTIV